MGTDIRPPACFIRADIWSKQPSPVPLKLVVFRSIPRIRLISVIVFQLLAVAIRLLNCRNPDRSKEVACRCHLVVFGLAPLCPAHVWAYGVPYAS
jgi:hypothetical protein